jgi:hypothetical protein
MCQYRISGMYTRDFFSEFFGILEYVFQAMGSNYRTRKPNSVSAGELHVDKMYEVFGVQAFTFVSCNQGHCLLRLTTSPCSDACSPQHELYILHVVCVNFGFQNYPVYARDRDVSRVNRVDFVELLPYILDHQSTISL